MHKLSNGWIAQVVNDGEYAKVVIRKQEKGFKEIEFLLPLDKRVVTCRTADDEISVNNYKQEIFIRAIAAVRDVGYEKEFHRQLQRELEDYCVYGVTGIQAYRGLGKNLAKSSFSACLSLKKRHKRT